MDEHELARLLSGRDRPSVLEKEEVFERVYARTRAASMPRSRWAVLGGLTAAAAAAAVWLALPADRVEFGARGAGESRPTLHVVCLETGRKGVCGAGGRLAFEIEGRQFQHVAVFARRQDGLVIWYFPESSGTSPPVSGQGRSTLLRRGVQLGATQPPGDYEVYAVFSDEALTRDRIKAGLDDDFNARGGWVVTHQTLRIEAGP